jgi:hypothetical protein
MIPGGIVSTLFAASSVAAAVDAFFNRTAMILTGETSSISSYLATNANTVTVDQGTNNFPITSSTSLSQGSVTPFSSTGGSYSFNGSSSVTVPTSTLSFNYHGKKTTFEFWVFPKTFSLANGGAHSVLSNMDASGAASQVGISLVAGATTGPANVAIYSTTPNGTIQSTGTIQSGQWNHVVVQVDVTTPSTTNEVVFFINGVKETKTFNFNSVSSGSGASTTALSIGGNGYASNYVNGHISNVRIVQDANYVYTGESLVPPTAPLTQVTGTKLLAATNSAFWDMASNTALGVTGAPAVSPMSPFTPVNPYNAGAPSKGVHITSTNKVEYPNHSSLNFGSGDFTIEFWMYQKTSAANASVICRGGGVPGYILGMSNNSLAFWCSSNGANYDMVGGATIGAFTLNSWHHVALSRVGTNIFAFINGQLKQTFNVGAAAIYDNGYATTLGYWTNGGAAFNDFNGIIQDLRITKGTGLYSSTFVPPTEKPTASASTSLLACQDGSVFDKSTNLHIPTIYGVPVPSNDDATPVNGSSIVFTGSAGSYLQLGGQTNFAFGTGDFTIEMWYFPYAISNQQLYSSQASGSYVTAPDIWMDTSARINLQVGGVGNRIVSSPITVQTWHHIALSRVSGVTTMYVNGEVSGSPYTDNNNYIIPANRPLIGGYGYSTNAYPLNGIISDLRVVKGTAVYTGRFNPPTSKLTEVSGTSLMLNNGYLGDGSSNKFPVTAVNNVKRIGNTPYDAAQPGAWSTYFNGSSYVQMAKSSNFLFSGDFTIEGWVMMPTVAGNIFTLSSANNNGWNYDDSSSLMGGLALTPGALRLGSSQLGFASDIFSPRKWQHFAVTRSGTTVKVFVDGVEKYSTTYGAPIGSANAVPALGILDKYSGSARYFFTGHISNFRVVNGTALYTAGFTVPTSPLSEVANTKMLTCVGHKNGDYSANNTALTVTGNLRPSKFNSPFGYGLQNNGSFLFDGSSYAVTGASTMASIFGSNLIQAGSSFTIEAWMYQTQRHTGAQPVMMGDMHHSSTTAAMAFGPTNAGLLQFYWYDGAARNLTGDTVIPLNQWTHVAVVSEAGVMSLFVNGVRQTATGTSTLSTNTTGTGFFNIGRWNSGGATNGFFGMISGAAVTRAVKYRVGFPVPTEPVVATSETTLLLTGNSGTIVDSSMKTIPVSTGTKLSTTTKKYGTASLQFGSSSVIDAAMDNILVHDKLTIEFWLNTAADSSLQVICHLGDKAVEAAGLEIGKGSANRIYLSGTSGTVIGGTTGSLVGNTWTHVAAVKTGGSWYLYQDGNLVGSATVASMPIAGTMNSVRLGGKYGTASYRFTGFIDDFRITLGARYTGNFTPPTTLLLK